MTISCSDHFVSLGPAVDVWACVQQRSSVSFRAQTFTSLQEQYSCLSAAGPWLIGSRMGSDVCTGHGVSIVVTAGSGCAVLFCAVLCCTLLCAADGRSRPCGATLGCLHAQQLASNRGLHGFQNRVAAQRFERRPAPRLPSMVSCLVTSAAFTPCKQSQSVHSNKSRVWLPTTPLPSVSPGLL